MNFWKRKAKSIVPIRMIGYKYSATGIFGYTFFHGRSKLCTVTSIVVPSPPVMIEGYGVRWKSDFDEESTLVPGLTRYVRDDAGHARVAGLVYRDCGEYEIDESVTVRCGDGSYSFFRDGEMIAQINRYQGKSAWAPESVEYDYEPHFEVLFHEEIDDRLKLLLFAFPMLRFGF